MYNEHMPSGGQRVGSFVFEAVGGGDQDGARGGAHFVG
jgi:hypothetical protein